jgi:hypothetical protein
VSAPRRARMGESDPDESDEDRRVDGETGQVVVTLEIRVLDALVGGHLETRAYTPWIDFVSCPRSTLRTRAFRQHPADPAPTPQTRHHPNPPSPP